MGEGIRDDVKKWRVVIISAGIRESCCGYVASEPGKGSVFTVRLPTGADA